MLYEIFSVIGVYGVYERWLQNQIDSMEKPSHVGVIMDGNRRWARRQNMIPWEGHGEGAEKVKTKEHAEQVIRVWELKM